MKSQGDDKTLNVSQEELLELISAAYQKGQIQSKIDKLKQKEEKKQERINKTKGFFSSLFQVIANLMWVGIWLLTIYDLMNQYGIMGLIFGMFGGPFIFFFQWLSYLFIGAFDVFIFWLVYLAIMTSGYYLAVKLNPKN